MILDSAFYVLQVLIVLRKLGAFASALIMKTRYWFKHVPGEGIVEYFKIKKIGECDSLQGRRDDVPIAIFCMKEPDYVMKIMSLYGGLTVKGE